MLKMFNTDIKTNKTKETDEFLKGNCINMVAPTEEEIKKVLGNEVKFFNGAPRLAIHLKEVLEKEGFLEKDGDCDIKFFDSSKIKEKEVRFRKYLLGEEK